MAGKIIFWDFSARKSLLFPSDANDAARRYADCPDDALLDMSTNDFAIEFKTLWDSTIGNTGNSKVIVQKCANYAGTNETFLNNNAGWAISLIPNTKRIKVAFNDGNASAISFYWDNIWDADVDTLFRLEFDRNVGCSLYKNGVFVSSKSDITTRTGSLSNNEVVRIGGNPGSATSYLKGSISLIRIDMGNKIILDDAGTTWYNAYPVNYGEVWNYENYLKIKHFWPEKIDHYLAAWYFKNSLADSSENAFTFVFYDGNSSAATATYGNPYPSYLEDIAFVSEPLMGSHEWGPIDLDNRQRSLDGTMRIYKTMDKMHKSWAFRTNDVEQIYSLMAAWFSNSPLHIYEDDSKPFFMRGFLVSPPTIKELIHTGAETLTALRRIWEVQLEFEEL